MMLMMMMMMMHGDDDDGDDNDGFANLYQDDRNDASDFAAAIQT